MQNIYVFPIGLRSAFSFLFFVSARVCALVRALAASVSKAGRRWVDADSSEPEDCEEVGEEL